MVGITPPNADFYHFTQGKEEDLKQPHLTTLSQSTDLHNAGPVTKILIPGVVMSTFEQFKYNQ